jgi:mannose-6-phosphate isomerase-like protein (cupin superfamily)
MNTQMNGKKIKCVTWPDGEEISGPGIYLSATYHGDRDEFWIIKEVDGKEVARFNPRFVDAISWDDQS